MMSLSYQSKSYCFKRQGLKGKEFMNENVGISWKQQHA